MALNQYLTRTRRLLQNPSAPTALYSDADLTDFINEARGMVAGEAECIRFLGSLATVNGTATYNFSSITNVGSSGLGVVLNARMIQRTILTIPQGKAMLTPWPWEYFNNYFLSKLGVAAAAPTDWAQYGQGTNGSIVFYPTPDTVYTLPIDAVWSPIALVDDSTIEAIPYQWTDAVPFLAAYFAYLAAQSGARQVDADRMMARYEAFMARARRTATPSVNSQQYEQQGPAGIVPVAGIAQPQQRAAQ